MINKKRLAISISIPLLIGIISSLLSNISTEFNTIIKPSFTPPAIVFPIVWTILYVLMGISSYIVYEYNSKSESLKIYLIQLLINGIWSIIFFKYKMFLFSFALILILIVLVLLMIKEFYKIDKKAGLLQVPYLIWLVFAGILNIFVYLLN